MELAQQIPVWKEWRRLSASKVLFAQSLGHGMHGANGAPALHRVELDRLSEVVHVQNLSLRKPVTIVWVTRVNL